MPDWAVANSFCRLLSGIPITDLKSLAAAIQVLHKTYQVPHVIITSLRLTRDNHTISSRTPSKPASPTGSGTHTPAVSQHLDAATSHPSAWPVLNNSEESKVPQINLDEVENLTIIGSTATSDFTPRLFRIDTPQLPLFFSGTGDMFAALTVPRLIEAVRATNELSSRPSWRSPDDVPAEELPLAKSCQKVLASMQAILAKTTHTCHDIMEAYDGRAEKDGFGQGDEVDEETKKKRHLALMNASEVKVVRHVKELIDPPHLERFKPRPVEEQGYTPPDVGKKRPDGLQIIKPGETIGSELNESGLKKIEPDMLESKEAQSQRNASKEGGS
jgi:pyridoxine kinase